MKHHLAVVLGILIFAVGIANSGESSQRTKRTHERQPVLFGFIPGMDYGKAAKVLENNIERRNWKTASGYAPYGNAFNVNGSEYLNGDKKYPVDEVRLSFLQRYDDHFLTDIRIYSPVFSDPRKDPSAHKWLNTAVRWISGMVGKPKKQLEGEYRLPIFMPVKHAEWDAQTYDIIINEHPASKNKETGEDQYQIVIYVSSKRTAKPPTHIAKPE